MITIDYTITIGNIVEIASIVLGGLYAVVTIRSNVGTLKIEVGQMQDEIRKITDILIHQADQNRRIIHLEEDLREMKHGKGFVQGDRGVDREY